MTAERRKMLSMRVRKPQTKVDRGSESGGGAQRWTEDEEVMGTH